MHIQLLKTPQNQLVENVCVANEFYEILLHAWYYSNEKCNNNVPWYAGGLLYLLIMLIKIREYYLSWRILRIALFAILWTFVHLNGIIHSVEGRSVFVFFFAQKCNFPKEK